MSMMPNSKPKMKPMTTDAISTLTLTLTLTLILTPTRTQVVSSIGVLSIRVKKSGNVVLSEKKPSYKDLEGAAEQAQG